MKKKLIFILFFNFIWILFLKAQQSPVLPGITTQLDSFLQFASQLYQFNGSVAISYNGNIILNKGYGFKNVPDKIINDGQTLFQIGSITKEFTSTLILLLEAQGKLSLQDKLSIYFPDFPSGDQITIHHLLSHTSGLYNYTDDISREDSAIICHPVSKERVLEQFMHQPLNFVPGNKYSYCNSGYFLLGMIIEKITGKPWEENVKQYILSPLHMNHTGFNFSGLKSPDKAVGYQVLKEDNVQPDITWDSTVSYAAGSMYSNTNDMLTWAKAVTAKQILTADSWKKAFSINLHGYGYGWEVDSLFGNKIIGHSGGIPGFSSNMLVFPTNNLQIIVLSNVHENIIVTPLSKILAAIVLKKQYTYLKPRNIMPVLPDELKAFTGSYRLDKNHIASIQVKDEKLYIEAISNMLPLTRLLPEEKDNFFLSSVTLDIQLKFERNKAGKVIGMTSVQNGAENIWKKI